MAILVDLVPISLLDFAQLLQQVFSIYSVPGGSVLDWSEIFWITWGLLDAVVDMLDFFAAVGLAASIVAIAIAMFPCAHEQDVVAHGGIHAPLSDEAHASYCSDRT